MKIYCRKEALMKSDIDLFADFLTEVITRHWDELEVSIFGKHKNEHIK